MVDDDSTREWELITLIPASSSSSSTNNPLLQGNFQPALHSPAAKRVLAQFAQSLNRDGGLPTSLSLSNTGGDEVRGVLELAIAALAAFVQLNWTGPAVADELLPMQLLRWAYSSAFPLRSISTADDASDEHEQQLERKLNSAALEGLTRNGEPAYHLCEQPFFLILALKVLAALSAADVGKQLQTLPWWRLRAASIHNRILDVAVSLSSEVIEPVDQLLETLASRVKASGESKLDWTLLQARLLLERGLALSRLGNNKEAKGFYDRAASASKLRYESSGALGKKTKFQKEDKTILVVLAESSRNALEEDAEAKKKIEDEEQRELSKTSEAGEEADEITELPKNGWKAAPAAGQLPDMPSNYALNDDTLLEQTRFSDAQNGQSNGENGHIDPSKQTPLAPLDQAILLALSLDIRNTSPEHGLTTSEISAFVTRVSQHPLNWSVFTMSLLLRSRLEATRTRTAERAVLQLQALLDQMPTTDSTASERLRYFYQLDLPSKWEMQAEVAQRYATLGVLRTALEIFEKIEKWEEVVHCLGALGRQEEGVEIIMDLLEGRKTEADYKLASQRVSVKKAPLTAAREAKLWCLLGDLQPANAEARYLKAWEVSGNRSARAARSLGTYYFSQREVHYGLVIAWLRRCLRISSLLHPTWFMLACAYMRREEWGKAARAFRRTVAIDEEDGEAWNNLASCYLRMVGGTTVEDLEADDQDDDEDGLRGGSIADGASDRQSDSGVELSSADETDEEGGHSNGLSNNREVLTPFVLKTLAHRCLRHSLRYHPDSWRVWSNYMIVSVDVGEMQEACRAFTRMVELKAKAKSLGIEGTVTGSGAKSGKLTDEDIDWAVLERLADAVVRGEAASAAPATTGAESTSAPQPTSYEAATSVAVSVPISSSSTPSSSNETPQTTPRQSPLYLSLLHLLTQTLPPLLSPPSPSTTSFPTPQTHIHQLLSRLYLSTRSYSLCLTANLEAYKASPAGDEATFGSAVSSSATVWQEAVQSLKQTVEMMNLLTDKLAEQEAGGEEGIGGGARSGDREKTVKESKFKTRSLLRAFMARYRESWEDNEQWQELLELKDEVK